MNTGSVDVRLNGTWVHFEGEDRFVFSDANFTASWRDLPSDTWENSIQGTFTFNIAEERIVLIAIQEWNEDSWENLPERLSILGDISVKGDTFVLSRVAFPFDFLKGVWKRQ